MPAHSSSQSDQWAVVRSATTNNKKEDHAAKKLPAADGSVKVADNRQVPAIFSVRSWDQASLLLKNSFG